MAWRRDPSTGIEFPLVYFRRIPYLDPSRAGDHKKIWDLNRCQELAVLSSQGEHSLVEALLDDWIAQNPVHRGMNWTSALEVAFRALSWLYVWHNSGSRVPARFLDVLYAHGVHLFYNLSLYFSPNTHLLGEAVALHALGLFFDRPDWQQQGRTVVLSCLQDQVFPDGSYFEQSTYYHVYALDFFHFHHSLEALPPNHLPVLERMGRFLQALLGEAGEIPFLGDDDGGRLYHPYANHSAFGRHTLARLWPVDPPPLSAAPSHFPDCGLVFLANEDVQILFDAGPFARGSAGHSHADSLSIVARRRNEEILIDPGTYTYVADPSARDLFRSSAMHNTVRLDGLDQATPAGPFRWLHPPEVRLLSTSSGFAFAECKFQGFVHQRRLQWECDTQRLIVEDTLSGPPGTHHVEQFWHLASPAAQARLLVESPPGFALSPRADLSFRSRAFGLRESAPALVHQGHATLPLTLRTEIHLGSDAKIHS